MVPKGKVREVAAMLKAIHAQENRDEALKKAKSVTKKLVARNLYFWSTGNAYIKLSIQPSSKVMTTAFCFKSRSPLMKAYSSSIDKALYPAFARYAI